MSQKPTTVTAVIATRDRPHLLRRALASVVAQAGGMVSEVIVVYDQSEPDRSLAAEFPQVPVRVITNTHSPGLAGARNSGIEAAHGEWIGFCDDDDAWTHNKIQQQLALAAEHPDVDFIVGGITIAFGGKRIDRKTTLSEISFTDLLHDRVMEAHPSTFLVRATAIDGYLGPVDEGLPGGYAEDYDWLLRAARKRAIAVVDDEVALIQWHTRSYFGNRWQMIDEALAYLVDKTPEFADDSAGLARILGQRAFAQAAQGRSKDAVSTARSCLKLDWRELRPYLALAVASRLVSAERLVKWANATGRGI